MALTKLSRQKLSGDWVPTVSGLTNLDSVTLTSGHFVVVGNVVMCFGTFATDQTTPAAATFQLSLPFPLDIQAADEIVGTAGGGVVGFGGSVQGNVANDTALVTFDTGSAAAQVTTVVFAYRYPE